MLQHTQAVDSCICLSEADCTAQSVANECSWDNSNGYCKKSSPALFTAANAPCSALLGETVCKANVACAYLRGLN